MMANRARPKWNIWKFKWSSPRQGSIQTLLQKFPNSPPVSCLHLNKKWQKKSTLCIDARRWPLQAVRHLDCGRHICFLRVKWWHSSSLLCGTPQELCTYEVPEVPAEVSSQILYMYALKLARLHSWEQWSKQILCDTCIPYCRIIEDNVVEKTTLNDGVWDPFFILLSEVCPRNCALFVHNAGQLRSALTFLFCLFGAVLFLFNFLRTCEPDESTIYPIPLPDETPAMLHHVGYGTDLTDSSIARWPFSL